MKQIFIIGGMGAGKSTARKALTDQGLVYIDLDKVGHDVLTWQVVKDDLVNAFGADILDGNGEVNRAALAKKAFVSPAQTRKLNCICMPRIEDAFMTTMDQYEQDGVEAVVVEYSVFKNRFGSLAYEADVVMAVIAPLEMRVQRAVAAGWDEEDVRNRIAHQLTDAERVAEADIIFNNEGTKEELYNEVVEWWRRYRISEHLA